MISRPVVVSPVKTILRIRLFEAEAHPPPHFLPRRVPTPCARAGGSRVDLTLGMSRKRHLARVKCCGSVARPAMPVVLQHSWLLLCLRVVIGPCGQDGGGEARDQPVVAEAVAELGVRNQLPVGQLPEWPG